MSLYLCVFTLRRHLCQADLKRLKKEVHSFSRVCQTFLSVNQPEIRNQVRAFLQWNTQVSLLGAAHKDLIGGL